MPAKRKVVEQVAEVMATGLEKTTDGEFDAALLGEPSEARDVLGDGAADTHEPTVTEEARPTEGAEVDAPPAVGRLVQSLLMDRGMSYDAIVAAVLEAHPSARTTARSVASTASVMRKKGTDVPLRGRRSA